MKKHYSIALITCGILSSMAANAERFNASNWLPPSHELAIYPYNEWIPKVKEATNGRIDFQHHVSGSLVPARSTMQGVRDGVAAVGVVFPPYTPAEFPLANVINDLSFTSQDSLAGVLAWVEVNLRNPKLQAEWKRNGGVFGGGYTTPTYELICAKPVTDLASTKGLKFRSAAGAHTEWIKDVQGVPVSVPIGDVYTGLERGSIDCAVADLGNLDSMKLTEVTKAVTLVGMGGTAGASWAYNSAFWKKISAADRRVLFDQMAYAIARTQVAWTQNAEKALAAARAKGVRVIQPSADLKEGLTRFNQKFTEELPKVSMERRKIADPSDVVNAYLESYKNWGKRLQEIDRKDDKAVGRLIKSEIYDKLDANTYGL